MGITNPRKNQRFQTLLSYGILLKQTEMIPLNHFNLTKNVLFLKGLRLFKTIICIVMILTFSSSLNTLDANTTNRYFNDDHILCDNFTDGGSIVATETHGCLPGFDPGIILNTQLPSGGSGAMEFMWMRTTNDPNSGNPGWIPLPTATDPDYDPPYITQTTAYRRCARRAGCDTWEIESNDVIIYVEFCPSCDNVDDGGEIGYDQQLCGDEADVSEIINVTYPSGGTGNLEYLWFESSVFIPFSFLSPFWSEIPGATSESYDPGIITQDMYYVRVARRELCQAYNGVSNIVRVTLHPEPIATTVVTDVSCNGGSDGAIDLTVSGGTPPYHVSWIGIGDQEDIDNLTAGTYTAIIRDAILCWITIEVEVDEPPVGTINLVPERVGCFGGEDGSIQAIAGGGTPPYQYLWDDPDGQTTSTAVGLEAGMYHITVTDANNCEAYDSIYLTEPDRILISIDKINVSCFGDSDGEASANPSGGTPPYTYQWNDPAMSITQTITNLAPGTYRVTVTDANNCERERSTIIREPDILTVDMSASNVSCNGAEDGSATATPTGGTPPYTYQWNDPDGQTTQTAMGLSGGTYSVTVTDENGCATSGTITINENDAISLDMSSTDITCFGDDNGSASVVASGGAGGYTYLWSNGANTATITDLAPGNYAVIVTDSDDCTETGDVDITEPEELNTNEDVTNASCYGDATGSVTVTASGGIMPYSIDWEGGASTFTINDLAAGDYSYTVTDENGCTEEGIATVRQPDELQIAPLGTNILCNGDETGSVFANVIGGTPPYSYEWNIPGDDDSIINLPAGNYSVTVTDANDCSASAAITLTEPDALEISESLVHILCNGDETGSIDINVTGGVAPYSYTWSNLAITQDIDNLPAGNYSVTVTDANGCTIERAYTIGEPDALEISTEVTGIACNGINNGSITVTAFGGTPAYTIVWNTGATTFTIDLLSAGTYAYTVTDANGCFVEGSEDITQPDELSVEVSTTDILCFGDMSGVAEAIVGGGTPPYTYIWNVPGSDAVLTGLGPGTYSVTVTDANGCEGSASDDITEPDELTISIDPMHVTCYGDGNGSATATVSGGTGTITYQWDDPDGQTTATANGLEPGTYSVVATDENGCQVSESTTIDGPHELVCNAEIITEVQTYGGNEGEGSVSVTGGSPPYTYLWSNGEASQSISGLEAGTYTVTVTDANGCTCESSFILDDKSSIGDYVWHDENENGIQDDDEDGIEGVQVILTGIDINGDPVTDTTYTDDEGMYLFDGLLPGNYKVTFVTPDGYNSTLLNAGSDDSVDSDADPAIGGMTDFIVLMAGEHNPDLDAGYVAATIDIGDYLWHDENMDGIQDDDESGVNDVPIHLYEVGPDGLPGTADDVLVDTYITTDDGMGNSGFYIFEDVPVGTYYVQVDVADLPPGFNFSPDNQGTDDELDSDIDDATGMSHLIVITNASMDDFSIDIGINNICDNVTDGGVIFGNETGCGPSFDPGLITSLAEPMGGTGMLEYIWLESVVGPPFYIGSPYWVEIPGSNSPEYDPGPIMYTTYYIRCARRVGCDDYTGESNIIIKVVGLCDHDCDDNIYTAGLIAGTENICVGDDPAEITSAELPDGGVGPVEYRWLSTTDDPLMGAPMWNIIAGATSETYDPGPLTVSTYYVRQARSEGCTEYGNSNIVLKLVIPTPSAIILDAPTTACLGEGYRFEAADIGGNYQWFFGTASIPAASTDRIVDGVEWTTVGTKTVVLTVGINGCTDSEEVMVEVIDDPTICTNLVFNFDHSSAVIIEDEEAVALDWSVTTGLDNCFFALQRSVDGGSSFDDLNSTLTDFSNGYTFDTMDESPVVGKNLYRIKATSPFGHVYYSDEMWIDYRVGYEKTKLYVYPNPVMNQTIYLNFVRTLESSGEVIITNTAGIIMGTYPIDSMDAVSMELDIRNFPAGVYFLKVHAKNAPKSVIKVIKITD